MKRRAPNSNIEWKKWGEKDPLWGVATWPGKEKGGTDPWTDEAFYHRGQFAWQNYQERWCKYGVDNRSCLEIGCGAGRLTIHLAKFFQRTYAVDVSEGMLAYARQHINKPSVHFQLVDGTSLPVATNSITAVFSTYVFQHFDSLTYATQYFREISRILTIDGSMMIHLPIFHWPPKTPKIFRALVGLRRELGDRKAQIRRWFIVRELSKPIMRNLVYPVDYFYDTLPGLGLTDLEVTVTTIADNGAHAFIFARKNKL